MAWNFDTSLLVFLSTVFISWSAATKLKSFVPMPLIMGLIFIAMYGFNIFPRDIAVKSNMVAVGVIAFSVLVIHSGTMINPGLIFSKPKESILSVTGALMLIPFIAVGLSPVIGRELAMLSSGSIIGGGAACAIASRWVSDSYPNIAVFPWLIFMFQGLFSVPIITYALKKESEIILNDFQSGKAVPVKKFIPKERNTICGKLPESYKNTAYYLGIIMLVWIINKQLCAVLSPFINININATALIFGFILGQTGLIDKAPLNKSDSFGLLLLGLMGLMANTLAVTGTDIILKLIPPLLIAFVASCCVLITVGILGAKLFKFSIWRGIILTMNSVTGFPVNELLINGALKKCTNDEQREYLKSQIAPLLVIGTMLVSNALSIFLVSIIVSII